MNKIEIKNEILEVMRSYGKFQKTKEKLIKRINNLCINIENEKVRMKIEKIRKDLMENI